MTGTPPTTAGTTCPTCGARRTPVERATESIGALRGLLFTLCAAMTVGVTVLLAAVGLLGTVSATSDIARAAAMPLGDLPGVTDPLRAVTVGVPLPLAVLAVFTTTLDRRWGVWVGLAVFLVGCSVVLSMTLPPTTVAAGS